MIGYYDNILLIFVLYTHAVNNVGACYECPSLLHEQPADVS